MTGDLFARLEPVRLHAYLLWLVLAGFALFGRGFAYVPVGPMFIGDAVLVLGLLPMMLELRHGQLPVPRFAGAMLAAFLVWNTLIAVRWLPVYGFACLRDAVTFGYALAGLLAYGCLAGQPQRLAALYRCYAGFAGWFLLIIPVLLTTAIFAPAWFPRAPNAPGTALLKPGDVGVHLAAAITYGILNPGAIPRLSLLMATVTVVLVSLSRAALVIQALTAALLFALQPTARRPLLAAATVMALLIGLLAIADFDIEIPGRDRSYSVQQLALGIASVVSRVDQGDLESTKTWRTDWWHRITDYTFGGAYFWTGKGYGVNLADDDGFQVIEAGSGEPLLRHPHSVHLSFLARSGVPGLFLWVGVLISLGHLLVTAWRQAGPRRRHLLLFHGVFLGAALLNASFDVYLEGPTGGIWFWFHAGCMAAVAMTPALDETEPA